MKYIFPALSLLMLIPLMLFSSVVKAALPDILSSVSRVVLCTLFPAGVLLRVFCFSPLAKALFSPLSKSRLWLSVGLPSSYIPSVISGQLSGFPMTACLADKGKNRAKAIALGSVASPAFLSAILTPSSGLLLWINQLMVLYTFSFFVPTQAEEKFETANKNSGFALIMSDAINAALAISGSMIFFSVLLSFLPTGVPQEIKEFSSALLEIGTASAVCENPVFLSLALSFGGFSAASQISFFAQGVDMKPYFISRALLFLPTLLFFVYPQIRLFESILIFLVMMWQIVRIKYCKN